MYAELLSVYFLDGDAVCACSYSTYSRVQVISLTAAYSVIMCNTQDWPRFSAIYAVFSSDLMPACHTDLWHSWK